MSWWLNFYFGEGPGISKDAPKPTGLRRIGQTVMREWWNLILLNILFIATALPLVTLPAGYVAMARILNTMVDDEPYDLWYEFRTTFIRALLPATLAGLIIAPMIASILWVIRVYAQAAQDALLFALPLGISVAVLTYAVMVAVVFLGLTATSSAPAMDRLRASAVTSVVCAGPLLAGLVINAVLWLAHIAGYPATILFAVTINFSLGALLMAFAASETAREALIYVRRSQQTPTKILQ